MLLGNELVGGYGDRNGVNDRISIYSTDVDENGAEHDAVTLHR